MRYIGRKTLLMVSLVILSLFAFGCGLTGSKNDSGSNQAVPGTQDNDQAKKKTEITLYFADDQAIYLVPEKRFVEQSSKPVAELLINELIKGPQGKNKGIYKTIPPEAKLISLEIKDGVAILNFSKEMMTKHWGGTAGEQMTVQSIVYTLTQLPEIQKVQFLIEGKIEESIWGHGDTTQPIGPAEGMLKPQ